jgi:hypothetical protein
MIIPKKLPKDPNQRAHQIARMLTEGAEEGEVATDTSERMARLGSKGGRKGGIARRSNISEERRREIGKKAALTRWKSKS